jgi:hypothetical protein
MTSSIKALLPRETADLLTRPPLPSEWIPVRHSIAINEAVGSVAGARGVRDMNRESLRTTLVAMAMPILRGLGRMFGVSPATLYSRLDLILKSSSRGASYAYEPLSEESGHVVVRSATPMQSRITAEAWAAGFELVLGICGRAGKVEVVDVKKGASDSTMRFLVDWTEKS